MPLQQNKDGSWEADVATAQFMKPDPALITVDFSKLDDLAKKSRDAQNAADKKNPPIYVEKPPSTRKEYESLRKQLFDLEQNAQGAEIRLKQCTDDIAHYEQQIIDLQKQKKNANPMWERSLEKRIQYHEESLQAAQRALNNRRQQNTRAAESLRAWPHRARLVELKEQLNIE
jgi:septal ring factor EnvC (AmiA/AmiB activator)